MSEHPAIRMIQHIKDCRPDKWSHFYTLNAYIQYHVNEGANKELLKPQRDKLATMIKADPELRLNYKEYVLPNNKFHDM